MKEEVCRIQGGNSQPRKFETWENTNGEVRSAKSKVQTKPRRPSAVQWTLAGRQGESDSSPGK